jgi:TM2 domain-containing membrane protein YozV
MICQKCAATNDVGATYCRKCGSTLMPERFPASRPANPMSMEVETIRYAVARTPRVAFLFSAVFPGLGQFYNGDFKKGALILLLHAMAWLLAAPTGLLSVFLVIPIWLWGTVNAVSVASRRTPIWS